MTSFWTLSLKTWLWGNRHLSTASEAIMQRAEGKLYRWWTSWQLLTCWLPRNRMGAGPCMPRNWHNRRRTVPPTDTVIKYSGNSLASYQAPGTEVPIRGTTRWAEFTSQKFALRLEWGHPGRSARKAEAKTLVKVFFSPAHSSALRVAQPWPSRMPRTRECGPRKELRNSPWDGRVIRSCRFPPLTRDEAAVGKVACLCAETKNAHIAAHPFHLKRLKAFLPWMASLLGSDRSSHRVAPFGVLCIHPKGFKSTFPTALPCKISLQLSSLFVLFLFV